MNNKRNGCSEVTFPGLCIQYKNSPICRKLNFKQQTDFAFGRSQFCFSLNTVIVEEVDVFGYDEARPIISGKLKLRRVEPNAPEEFVFPHIAALFGTLTSVWLRQRSTTLHKKTSPSGAKQFLKSKFLSRQGKKVSNAGAL